MQQASPGSREGFHEQKPEHQSLLRLRLRMDKMTLPPHSTGQSIKPAQIQGMGKSFHLTMGKMQSHITKCMDAGKDIFVISLPKGIRAGHA